MIRSAWTGKQTVSRANFARADLYHSETFGLANQTDKIVWDDWFFDAAAVLGSVTSGGLHHLQEGYGDPGVAAVPQTLHTIDCGIIA